MSGAGVEAPVALVTGASRGIGAATARALSEDGFRVVLAARSTADLCSVRRDIEASGGTALDLPTDVSEPAAVGALVDAIMDTWGRLDIAVNNAAAHGGRPTPTAELDIMQFDTTMAVSVRGVFLCLQHEVLAMQATGGGAIVNVASTAAVRAVAGLADYVAAKHAVLGLTRTAALDHAADGIRVNAILPGPIRTDGLERAGAAAREAVAARLPLHRLGAPEDVARLVSWLVGPDATFVTGGAFTVDGGLLAGDPAFGSMRSAARG